MLEKIIVRLILIIVLSAILFNCHSGSTDEKNANRQSGNLHVEGVIVKPVILNQIITISGTLKPFEETVLKPETAGRVVYINLSEGGFVRQGTLLVKLFDDDLQAQLKKSQAQQKIVEQTQIRQGELMKVNGISQLDFDQTVLQLNSIKADIEVMKVLIRKTEVHASFDGTVGLRNISRNLDFAKLQQVLPKFLDAARKDSVFGNVDVNLKFNKPEINLTVNRLKATDLGVNEADVSTTLQLALSGRRYDYFLSNGKQYQVIGQVERPERSQPADITSLYVRNNTGKLIQLDNLVNMEENSSPPTLYHYNRYKSATISASLAQGKTLGEGIAEMNKIAGKLLDSSFHTDLFGASRDFVESSSNISFALVFAMILIYLILAAQFESFRNPFIIMSTVPLALAGAMLSLWLFGKTLNIFSEIGMIMLIGIVTKNGILIVEFANQKRKTGLKIAEAAFEAAAARLRPILMTSLATVFGALPIAFALGAGAQSRVPLGVVVVGGLLFALILTLFVIPVMYILMADKNLRKMDSANINLLQQVDSTNVNNQII